MDSGEALGSCAKKKVVLNGLAYTAVAASPVGRYFRLEGCGHPNERQGSRFLVEIRAGLTTAAGTSISKVITSQSYSEEVLAMLYIIAVNASILTDSGGPCECSSTEDPICTNDPDYNACLSDLRRQLVIATAAISAISSFLMGACWYLCP